MIYELNLNEICFEIKVCISCIGQSKFSGTMGLEHTKT